VNSYIRLENMVNERITENIVRKHFNSYSNECIIEEQKSSNPKIDKLLKNASKRGGARGILNLLFRLKTVLILLL